MLGSGRPPILFGALKQHGYQMHLVSASSVDWMGLKDGVFGEVKDELETDWTGEYPGRDAEMMRRARALGGEDEPAEAGVPLPVLLRDPLRLLLPGALRRSSRRRGTARAASRRPASPREHIQNRARNAAHEVDWKLEEFLSWYEAKRGRRPLILFTGDHGEEFRERGRIGHGSDVTNEQIQVPMVLTGEGVPRGRFSSPTSHTDLVPSLLPAARRHERAATATRTASPLWASPKDRFVLATVGWEPTYAAIGPDVKVRFAALDGFGRVQITDPKDVPAPRRRRAVPADRAEDPPDDGEGPGEGGGEVAAGRRGYAPDPAAPARAPAPRRSCPPPPARLSGAVALHAREPEREARRIVRARLHARRTRSRRRARAGRGRRARRVASSSARSRSVCHASISSVSPLNVFPSITKPPLAGSRAPRCRFESQPSRRPLPHSAASTTRSSVCARFTLSQLAPRRPASYGASSDFAMSPSCPRASASARNARGRGPRRR